MASPRNRRHIIVPGEPTVEKYTPHGRKIEVKKPPAPTSRPAHGAALKQSMELAVDQAAERREVAANAGITVALLWTKVPPLCAGGPLWKNLP